MSDGSPESHGVYGGTQRDDGKMQEEPAGVDGVDEEGWGATIETGGDATEDQLNRPGGY